MPAIITAAGGNATVIERLTAPEAPAALAARGRQLLERYAAFAVEQAGFLLPPTTASATAHFAMAGGEFCGNAARAAALLLAPAGGQVAFTLSGFNGLVQAQVNALGAGNYAVSATFPGLRAPVQALGLLPEGPAALVDLGGIVHVVLTAPFPRRPAVYRAQHRRLCQELGLTERAAVGLIWCERSGEMLVIHPLVWVRALDSFFYESSCGSGTIAAGAVYGSGPFLQPSGQPITVELTDIAISLSSSMALLPLK